MSARSLDLVLAQVQAHRSSQERQFDGLDTKAGIALGLAGAVASLSALTRTWAGEVASISAVGSALFALWAFFPRRYPELDLRPFRDRYVGAEEAFTKLHLLDTQIIMASRAEKLVEGKGFRLRIAIIALGIAVLFAAADRLVT